jgi:hypothetical protein
VKLVGAGKLRYHEKSALSERSSMEYTGGRACVRSAAFTRAAKREPREVMIQEFPTFNRRGMSRLK